MSLAKIRDTGGSWRSERGVLRHVPAETRRILRGLPSGRTLHSLAEEFSLAKYEVLDLIAGARRLKMAVRWWVAEHHLLNHLRTLPGVSDCRSLDMEGAPGPSNSLPREPPSSRRVQKRSQNSYTPRRGPP